MLGQIVFYDSSSSNPCRKSRRRAEILVRHGTIRWEILELQPLLPEILNGV